MLTNEQVKQQIEKDGLVYFFKHYVNVEKGIFDPAVSTLLLVIQQFVMELEKQLDCKIEM